MPPRNRQCVEMKLEVENGEPGNVGMEAITTWSGGGHPPSTARVWALPMKQYNVLTSLCIITAGNETGGREGGDEY